VKEKWTKEKIMGKKEKVKEKRNNDLKV